MISFAPRISSLFRSQWTVALLVASVQTASAQAFCSSDGQARPIALLERFINADCDGCWKDPTTPSVQAGQMALDWVLPGSKGDDAPLSAVASRDGVNRLEVLGEALPDKAASSTRFIKKPGLKGSSLRVSRVRVEWLSLRKTQGSHERGCIKPCPLTETPASAPC